MEERARAVGGAVQRGLGFDPAHSVGLFVGVSEFPRGGFPTVPFAVDDAIDLAHLFSVELGLIRPERVWLALAGTPRKAATVAALDALLAQGVQQVPAVLTELADLVGRLPGQSGPRGLFIFAMATHGVSDQGTDHLLTTDTVAARMIRTSLSVNELFDDVSKAGAPRRLVILDACRERLTEETRQVVGPGMSASFAAAIARADGQAVLSGTTLGGYSYDDLTRKNGVFTAALIDGLRGSARGDEQGFITVASLAQFAEERVLAWVAQNRPGHKAKSRGIGKRIDGPVESLPLAINPQQADARQAEEAKRQARQERIEAAVTRLFEHRGRILASPLCVAMEAALKAGAPGEKEEALLQAVEALDGSDPSRRVLRDLWRELWPEGEQAAAKPRTSPPPEAPKPARVQPVRPEAPGASGGRWLRGWRLWAAVVGVGLGAILAWRLLTTSSSTAEQAWGAWSAGAVQVNSSGMRFRYIPAGRFWMGSPATEEGRYDDEGPRHEVELSRGFWLGETEVTQGQWSSVAGKNPSRFTSCGPSCPVEQVSWWEAVEFANRLSAREGLAACYELSGCTGTLGAADFACASAQLKSRDCPGYRLPTEGEWEYAARAGTSRARYQSDPSAIAWYSANSGGETHPVGGKPANAWVLHDMLGNVLEWCWDFSGTYSSDFQRDPSGASSGSGRVIRGGSWSNHAQFVRAAVRYGLAPSDRYDFLGFRLARGQSAAPSQ